MFQLIRNNYKPGKTARLVSDKENKRVKRSNKSIKTNNRKTTGKLSSDSKTLLPMYEVRYNKRKITRILFYSKVLNRLFSSLKPGT